MGFFQKLKKKEEINNDYEINNVEKYKPTKGFQEFTDEDRQASAETRRRKAKLKQMEMAMEEKRLLRDMSREDFEWQLDQEERLERLKSLKMENLKGGGENQEDTIMMHLLSMIQAKNAPQPQPQYTPYENSFNGFGMPGQQMPQNPQIDEEWQPQSRFTNEQMTDLLKKMPGQVIQTIKSLEEDEVLQAYDIIKTM